MTKGGETSDLAAACQFPYLVAVSTFPPPQIAWQLTGNHWLSVPCIHPADGSIRALGVLHRGARAAVEFAGGAGFVDGSGEPLLAPVLTVNGEARSLAESGMAWERAYGWLPTFSSTAGDVVVRGTIFAPHGRDADVAGAVYMLSVENRGAGDADVTIALAGILGHRQLRVRTPRAFDDGQRAVADGDGVVILEGTALPGLAALALAADGDAAAAAGGADGRFRIERRLRVPAGERGECAFFIAVGPERDGARSTVAAMRRRGWRDLLAVTRDALRAMEQSTGSDAIDRVINRNLLFAFFFAVGRALDDAHFYLVRSRAPWNALGTTVREWEALSWTLPAIQLADPSLARELLLRMCEVHGYSPGNGVHYLDGTLFEPGFSLEGVVGYALAVDRYIRDTRDDQIVEEPIIADTLYLSSEDLAARRDEQRPLYSTEVLASGEPAPFAFTLHGNAGAAQALEVFRRTLDEETAKEVEDPEAVRAALRRHFSVDADGKTVFASAVDLKGGVSLADDPAASALWLPMFEVVDRTDSTYRRTAKRLGGNVHHLAQHCARLVGPDAAETLKWIRRATLDNGLAAEFVTADGAAQGNGGDAALSGLLAHSIWYAVHVGGVRA